MEKNRLEAFSDGVIAIIITIMVLELKVPKGLEWENLYPVVPKFLGYILSFLAVAIYWVNHHHLLFTIKKVTPAIMWANINLLFWLSLIPFATAWMGENHFANITVIAYAILAMLCAVAYTILQNTICRTYSTKMLTEVITKQTSWKLTTSIVLYITSIPVTLFLHPFIAGLMFLIVSVLWLIPDKNIEKSINNHHI